MTDAVQSTTTVSSGSMVVPPTSTNPVSAMPDPELDPTQDALARLLVALTGMQKEQTNVATTQVGVARSERQLEQTRRQNELAAAERAARAKAKGGIFGWLKKDIGVLGVVGLATFNYGLVAADIALHKTGVVKDVKLDVADAFVFANAWIKPELVVADILLRKLDATPHQIKDALDEIGLGESTPGISDQDVKPIVDKMVTINLMVAGAAASVLTAGSTTALVIALVAAAMSAGAFASGEAGGPEWLTMSLAIGGAATSLGGGIASGVSAMKVAGDASRIAAANAAAGVVTATNGAIGGIDTMIAASHQKDVDDHTINAEEAKNAIARLEHMLDELIDTLKEGKDAQKRITEGVNQLLDTYDNSLINTAAIRV